MPIVRQSVSVLVCAVTSVYGLVTVNLERYVAIVYHYRYRVLFTKRNKYLIIASCWMIGVFVQSHNLFLYGEDESSMCKFWGWPNKGVRVVAGCINFLVPFLLPFIFMIMVQWKGISTLKRQIELLHIKMGETELQHYVFLILCKYKLNPQRIN